MTSLFNIGVAGLLVHFVELNYPIVQGLRFTVVEIYNQLSKLNLMIFNYTAFTVRACINICKLE